MTNCMMMLKKMQKKCKKRSDTIVAEMSQYSSKYNIIILAASEVKNKPMVVRIWARYNK